MQLRKAFGQEAANVWKWYISSSIDKNIKVLMSGSVNSSQPGTSCIGPRAYSNMDLMWTDRDTKSMYKVEFACGELDEEAKLGEVESLVKSIDTKEIQILYGFIA